MIATIASTPPADWELEPSHAVSSSQSPLGHAFTCSLLHCDDTVANEAKNIAPLTNAKSVSFRLSPISSVTKSRCCLEDRVAPAWWFRYLKEWSTFLYLLFICNDFIPHYKSSAGLITSGTYDVTSVSLFSYHSQWPENLFKLRV